MVVGGVGGRLCDLIIGSVGVCSVPTASEVGVARAISMLSANPSLARRAVDVVRSLGSPREFLSWLGSSEGAVMWPLLWREGCRRLAIALGFALLALSAKACRVKEDR